MVTMKVRNAFLANHAETREVLAFDSGGCPEVYAVFSLPQEARLAAVWVVELQDEEIGFSFAFQLGVSDPREVKRGVAVVGVGRSPDTPRVQGSPLYAIVTYLFSVEFQVGGLHNFEIVSGGEVLATMPLFVRVIERSVSDEARAEDSATR
jgi:hypothetical protein